MGLICGAVVKSLRQVLGTTVSWLTGLRTRMAEQPRMLAKAIAELVFALRSEEVASCSREMELNSNCNREPSTGGS